MTITLDMLGWDEAFDEAFRALGRESWYPARIIRETKINYTVLAEGHGDHEAVLSGKVWHDAATDADLPTVGDWVAVDPGTGEDLPVIRALLPRRTRFSRKAPGKSAAEQVIGANVDLVVVVTDAGADFNPRRMERYMTLIRRSGATPLVLVNKADATPPEELEAALAALRRLAPDVGVHAVSALNHSDYPDQLRNIPKGRTVTVVGSSGVGKSTLVNSLLGGAWLDTGDVNEVTGKGRHTTVARELVVLLRGGLLIDNPGMREVQMWTDPDTLRAEFADLAALAAQCRFADCSHGSDRGCAVREAVESGAVSRERYEHFLRLDEEVAELAKRAEKRQMTLERVTKRHKKHTLRNRQDKIDHLRDMHPNRKL